MQSISHLFVRDPVLDEEADIQTSADEPTLMKFRELSGSSEMAMHLEWAACLQSF